MVLEDATGQASVDIFLRSLQFEFPVRDIVGIPGNLIGIEGPYPETKIALLLHELEHISRLTYPLGAVFTSLAVRALDLRNDMASQYKEISNRFVREGPSEALNNAIRELITKAKDVAEFARTTNLFMELMAPLLEGLALMAECELNGERGTWDWYTLLSMEYQYALHFLWLTDHDAYREALGNPAELEELWDPLQRQVAAAREIRRREVIDLMSFKQDEGTAPRTAPYCYGYLFLTRLYQEWRLRMPDLTIEGFFEGASSWVGSVLPLTVVELFSNKDKVNNRSLVFPKIFEDMLLDALSFSASHIDELRSSPVPLIWLSGKRLLVPDSWYRAHEPIDACLMSHLLWSVFDVRESDETLKKTGLLIRTLEKAKKLVRTAVRDVEVVGVDEEFLTLLIFERQRRNGAAVSPTGVTFFRFPNEEMYRKFLALIDDSEKPLQRIKLGSIQYRVGEKRFVDAKLLTYLHFWPSGVPRPHQTQDVPLPFGIVRVLVISDQPSQFFLATNDDVGEVAELVRFRDHLEKTLEGFAAALALDYAEVRYVLEELRVISSDYWAKLGAEYILNILPQDEGPALRSSCRMVYSRVLFPAVQEAAFTLMRFDTLSKSMGLETLGSLKDWLRHGLLLTPDSRCEITPGTSAIDDVKRASLDCLGIPLVRRNGNAVELDLVPPKA